MSDLRPSLSPGRAAPDEGPGAIGLRVVGIEGQGLVALLEGRVEATQLKQAAGELAWSGGFSGRRAMQDLRWSAAAS